MADPFLSHLLDGLGGDVPERAPPMKRLLALLGVGLIVLGILAAAVAVSSSLSARPASKTQGRPAPPSPGQGMGEDKPTTAVPPYAYTLVLLNNTLIPGNFPAQ